MKLDILRISCIFRVVRKFILQIHNLVPQDNAEREREKLSGCYWSTLILIKKVCDQQGHFAMIFRSERYHELTLSAFYLEKEYIDKARRVFHVFTGVSRPANVTKGDTKVSRNCSTCHKAHINSILFCSSFARRRKKVTADRRSVTLFKTADASVLFSLFLSLSLFLSKRPQSSLFPRRHDNLHKICMRSFLVLHPCGTSYL